MPDERGHPESSDPAEHRRIRDVYRAYTNDPYRQRIWSTGALWERIRGRQWTRLHAMLDRSPAVIGDSWALDLGTGPTADGDRLSTPGRILKGILIVDLLHEWLVVARRTNGSLVPIVGDGALLPLRGGSVGIAYQSTMLSSVLDMGRRSRIFDEIRRILRPGGAFVSYDTRYPNPWNTNTRPVGLAELRAAFAGWWQATESITGIPQILRVVAPVSPAACSVVEAVPFLRSHRLFVAVKPAPANPA